MKLTGSCSSKHECQKDFKAAVVAAYSAAEGKADSVTPYVPLWGFSFTCVLILSHGSQMHVQKG